MSSKLKEVKKPPTTVLKSVTRKGKDGKEVRISVEEIENGFLITKNTEWQDPKGGYQFESKKYYSDANPLEFTENKTLAEAFES